MTAVFTDAAGLIKRKGLARGTNRGPKGEVCILQAVEDVLPKTRDGQPIGFSEAFDRLRTALNGEHPEQWNDRVADVSQYKKDTDRKNAQKQAQWTVINFLKGL